MRGRRHKLQVSTFPFLAVLLCAMGSLILVLLVMDRKAHKLARARAEREAARLAEEAAHTAAAHRAEVEQKKRQAVADWEKKRDTLHETLTREQIELQVQMRKVRDQLSEIAARLRYEQDTSTQLRHKIQDERGRLQEEERLLASLRGTADQATAQSQESSQTLRRMTIDLLQMEQVLKDLRAARQREQHTFSVVPYHGRRGESRRPIYVECTAEGVIFHPERRAMPVFSREYLVGRDKPGDAPPDDVRAEVERRIARRRGKQTGVAGATDATPYLLLLVRPDGIGTYCQFQAVLKDLTIDFGYEFIDSDWVLDFPTDEDQPSAQPWMTAAKTPTPAAPVTSPGDTKTPRPVGLSPPRPAVGVSGAVVQGFHTGEGPGSGLWSGSPSSQGGSGPFAPGGVPGGGSSAPSGVKFLGSDIGSPGSGGSPGGGGTGPAGGSGSNQPGQLIAQAPGLFGQGGGSGSSFGPSASSGGEGSRSGGIASGSGSVNGGHGHPAAMPPAIGNEGGEPGGSDSGGSPGGSYGPSGGFALRRSGGGSGSGSPAAGSPGPFDPGTPGLGPPRAVASADAPGTGYPVNGPPGTGASSFPSPRAGGVSPPSASLGGLTPPARGSEVASNGASGTGPPGNGIPGTGSPGGSAPGVQGVAGSGSPGSGTSGPSGSGSPISPSGQYAVARGNGGDNPGHLGGSGASLPGTQGAAGQGGAGGSSAGAAGGAASGEPGAMGSSPGNSGPGAQGAAGSGSPGSGTSGPYNPNSPMSPDGRYAVARGNGGDNPGPPGGSGGNTPGTAGAVPAGAQGATGQGGGGGTSTGAAGAGTPGQPGVMGNSPNNGAPSPPGGSGAAAYAAVDPLLPRPPAGSQPAQRPPDEPPPERSPDDVPPQGAPRKRVLGGGGGGSGERGDPGAAALNRFAPPSAPVPQARKPVALRPAWVHGGRDWTIYVECRPDGVVLYPSQRSFALAQAAAESVGNPLVAAIRQMIDRRQSARRPGEPPYYPKVCLLVRPEYVRTFLMVYPALEALRVPTTRQNLDPEDSVDDIVRGVNP
jgi:hypothetical protein